MPDSIITAPATPIALSPAAIVRAIITAAWPFVGRDSGPTLRQFDGVAVPTAPDEPTSPHVALVRALAPLFKDYTVADAVHMLGMLRTVATGTHPDVDEGLKNEDRTSDDILIGVCWILEKFASRARASGPECVSARARFLELVTEGEEDGWALGDLYEGALAKAVSEDVKAMRRGRFNPEPFGDGRSVGYSAWSSWLAYVVEHEEGLEAAKENLVGDVALQAAE